MRRVIYKYEVTMNEHGSVMLPKGAVILRVATQNDAVSLWAMVDADEIEQVQFRTAVVGTGNPIPAEVHHSNYRDTVQIYNGRLVFHVFVWAN